MEKYNARQMAQIGKEHFRRLAKVWDAYLDAINPYKTVTVTDILASKMIEAYKPGMDEKEAGRAWSDLLEGMPIPDPENTIPVMTQIHDVIKHGIADELATNTFPISGI